MKEGEDEVKGYQKEYHPVGKKDRDYYGKKKKMLMMSFSMTSGDAQLLDWLVEFLDTNRSDALRTCIRSFAAQMQALTRQPGRPKKGDEGGGFERPERG